MKAIVDPVTGDKVIETEEREKEITDGVVIKDVDDKNTKTVGAKHAFKSLDNSDSNNEKDTLKKELKKDMKSNHHNHHELKTHE